MSKHENHSALYVGLFLISVATLLLEVALTRILSVVQWHHFAFMVISIAFLGFGASGTILSVFPDLLKRNIHGLLTLLAGLFSVTTVGSFALTNRIPFDQFTIIWDRVQVLYLAIYYLAMAIPFMVSGLCIALLLTRMAERVGRLYFFNLIGSGVGCLVVVFLFWILDGPRVIVFAALLGALAALAFSWGLPKKVIIISGGLMAILILLEFHPGPFLEINITPYKDLPTFLRFPKTEVLMTRWNSFSRVDVIKGPTIRYAPGLSYQYQKLLPPQLGITTDGGGLTAITNYEGDLANLEFTDFLPSALAYRLRHHAKVLNIGVGGGLGVLTALYHGASSVIGVEVNPIVVDILRNRYRKYAGDVFRSQKVKLVVDEGRSFLRRTGEKFDVIQIYLLDSYGIAGAFGLSENYLYTVEAFEDYYGHLSPQGMLSITLWLSLPPRDMLRLCSLALTALENLGVEDPHDHITLIRSWGTVTFLLKKGKFGSQEKAEIGRFCRQKGFDIVYYSGIHPQEVNIYNRLKEPYYYRSVLELLSADDRTRFYEEYILDVAPTTDDRPFFHHFFKWKNLFALYQTLGRRWEAFVLWGDLILVAVLGQAVLGSLILILLPLWSFRRRVPTIRDEKQRGSWPILVYFLCLGIGYLFIEIVLIQKFILFLGRPIYAISVIICSLLTFSGVGSFLSERFEVGRLRMLLPLLCGLVLVYLVFLPCLFGLFLGQGLVARITLSVGCLAPLALFMGMPFPLGIRVANKTAPKIIPWAWATNTCSSVVSSVLATMLALYLGFSTVLVGAGLVYLLALGAIFSLTKST